jgi:hypothetical protein
MLTLIREVLGISEFHTDRSGKKQIKKSTPKQSNEKTAVKPVDCVQWFSAWGLRAARHPVKLLCHPVRAESLPISLTVRATGMSGL